MLDRRAFIWIASFVPLGMLPCCEVSAQNTEEHARLADVYSKFKAQQSAPEGVRIDPIQFDGKPVCGAVKLWAVKADRAGNEISGPINIALHDWEPDDCLYLYFESATPILIHLYQIYPETGHPQAGEKRVVLPREDFPQSFDAVPAGQAVKLPVLLKLDHTRVDESIAIALTSLDLNGINVPQTGNAVLDNPPVTKSADASVSGQGATFMTRRLEYASKLAVAGLQGNNYAIPPGARLAAIASGTNPGRIEPVEQGSNLNVGDSYKAEAVFTNRQAFFKLTIHK